MGGGGVDAHPHGIAPILERGLCMLWFPILLDSKPAHLTSIKLGS